MFILSNKSLRLNTSIKFTSKSDSKWWCHWSKLQLFNSSTNSSNQISCLQIISFRKTIMKLIHSLILLNTWCHKWISNSMNSNKRNSSELNKPFRTMKMLRGYPSCSCSSSNSSRHLMFLSIKANLLDLTTRHILSNRRVALPCLLTTIIKDNQLRLCLVTGTEGDSSRNLKWSY